MIISTWTATSLTAILTFSAILISTDAAAGGNVRAAAALPHPEIDMIDVMCDAGDTAMQVTVAFGQPFAGVIYSQGFFNQEKCRYVETGGADSVYTFRVPLDGCGSKRSCSLCDAVSNVLVIQSDQDVQEIWDTARRVTCDRPHMLDGRNSSKMSTGVAEHNVNERTIIFKPFVVDQLEVVNVPTARGGVDCWLDVQRGRFPAIQPLVETIQIGETLSVLVFLRDPLGAYDLIVRDCYAFDNSDYEAKTTSRLQLSDKQGCSRKPKLFGKWQRTEGSDARKVDATLVLHNALSAFKFPDQSQVFLKCEVEICSGKCKQQDCETAKPTITTTSTRRPVTVAARTTTTTTTTEKAFVRTTTETVACSRGSRRPECNTSAPSSPAPFTASTSSCFPGSRSARCRSTTTQPTTTTATADYRENEVSTYQATTSKPRMTKPNRFDTTPLPTTTMTPRRRPTPTTYQPSTQDTSDRILISTLPTIPSTTTRRHVTRPPTSRLTFAPDCYPGARDPRCPRSPNAEQPIRLTTTTPIPPTIAYSALTTTPFTRTTPDQRTTHHPRSQTTNQSNYNNRITTTTVKPCSPANDPRCSYKETDEYLPPFLETTKRTRTTTTTTTPRPRPTYAACPPGSRSPSCPPPDHDYDGPEYLPPFMDILALPNRTPRQSALPQILPVTNTAIVGPSETQALADRINVAFASAQQQMQQQRRRRRRRSIIDRARQEVEEAEDVPASESITFAMTVKGYEA